MFNYEKYKIAKYNDLRDSYLIALYIGNYNDLNKIFKDEQRIFNTKSLEENWNKLKEYVKGL